MFRPVEIPLWLLVLILLFAAVTFASHFLFPSVRWFLRKRAERLVGRLNGRLARPIEPFKLARRYDMINRLIYDPEISAAVVEDARRRGEREDVAFERAKRYAREIVPSFSATAYFTIGTRLARWLSQSFYQVRIGTFDARAIERIDPDAAVIFVMNHRSNMDYVLVTWLVSRASALSYAVGEWARVWPLSAVIRAMGAYFIRRQHRSQLYRRVLARYVQMATEGGVTQAFFPEGGLSLSGGIGDPRLGLLSYIVQGYRPGGRDVIFVPVGLNYDRVMEDRYLVAAQQAGVRRFRPPIGDILGGLVHFLWRVLRGGGRTLGTASVGFGTPLSLAAFLEGRETPPVEAVAEELMTRVRAVVPVLPVPLVARILTTRGPATTAEIEAEVTALLDRLGVRGVRLPVRTPGEIVADALMLLQRRGLVQGTAAGWSVVPAEAPILDYYAASIAHHFDSLERDAATAAQ